MSQSRGLITHVLRTRAPLSTTPKGSFSFHLHVLGPPRTFALSQDQTLQFELGSELRSVSLGICCVADSSRSRRRVDQRDAKHYCFASPTRSVLLIRTGWSSLVPLSSFQGALAARLVPCRDRVCRCPKVRRQAKSEAWVAGFRTSVRTWSALCRRLSSAWWKQALKPVPAGVTMVDLLVRGVPRPPKGSRCAAKARFTD